MKFLKNIVKPHVRQWIYRVSMAVIPLLVVAGIIAEEQVLNIVGLLVAVLAISVADGNVEDERTPVKDDSEVVDVKYEPRHSNDEDDFKIRF